jgi:hypothetical protein
MLGGIRALERNAKMPTTSRDSAQAHSYRNAAERIEDAETLPVGPAKRCPACKTERLTHSSGEHNPYSKLPAPRACSPAKRVSIDWFNRCSIKGSHLHESCTNCGHEWLSHFAGSQ